MVNLMLEDSAPPVPLEHSVSPELPHALIARQTKSLLLVLVRALPVLTDKVPHR